MPTVAEVKGTLTSLSSRLDTVVRAEPQIEKAVAELDGKLQAIQERSGEEPRGDGGSPDRGRAAGAEPTTTPRKKYTSSVASACTLRAYPTCQTHGRWSKRQRTSVHKPVLLKLSLVTSAYASDLNRSRRS